MISGAVSAAVFPSEVISKTLSEVRALASWSRLPPEKRIGLGRAYSVLELAFQTEKVRDICEVRETATECLGPPTASALTRRLAEIDATETMPELTTLLGDQIAEVSADERSIKLGTGGAIIVRSGHAITPKLASGGTDWTRVSRLRIMSIGGLS